MTTSNFEMDESTSPLSELYAKAGAKWADLDAAAQLLEDTKSAEMAQRQTQLGDIPVNRAEQIVKSSPEWMARLEQTVEARRLANVAKVQLEVIRMRYFEEANKNANARVEMKMVS